MSKRRSGSKVSWSSPRSDSATSDDAGLSKQIADVIMILDEDDAIPGTQPVDERVLKDVVAYVEVRSNSENRSRSVSKQLERLGAVVVNKFGPDVTHVIWKEGKKSTKDKAIKKGLHLVSVLWVDSCKQNQEHVAESLFPVYDPADGSPLMVAKLKRVKSMQPKTLEEELQNGTFKKRRRKRKLRAEDFEPQCFQNASPRVKHLSFQTASPSFQPRPKILVEETQQPMSPLRRIVGPDLTPTISLIPNTPESMRRALDSLSKRKMGTPTSTIFSSTDDSSPTRRVPLMKSKLFSSSSAASSSNDTDSTITNSRMHDTAESSDTEKEQRPAKRQRMSSGQKEQKKSAGKRKGKVSFEKDDRSETTTDAENEEREGKTKRSRASELSRVKKGRRSSVRLQRHSGESEEKSVDGIKNQDLSLKDAETSFNRLSEGKGDAAKSKKGRRSSVRVPKQKINEAETNSASCVTETLPPESSSNRLSDGKGDTTKGKKERRSSVIVPKQNINEAETKDDTAKGKKGRRSSVRFPKQNINEAETSFASCVTETLSPESKNQDQGLKDAESASNRLSEGKGEPTKSKKGRRSSVRVPKQNINESETKLDTERGKKGRRSSVRVPKQNINEAGTSSLSCVPETLPPESKESAHTETDQDRSVKESTSNRLSEGKGDTTKSKKGRRSSVRVPKQSINEAGTSSASCVAQTLPPDSKESAPKETDQLANIPVQTTTKKRRRRLMSTQCQPSEELIIPSQSTTKKTQTILGDDPYMFLTLGEEEEEDSKGKKKESTGRQKMLSSSRKRKKLISSSESENEPPEGSQQNVSTQSSNITLIPTSRRSLEEFKDQPSTKKKTRPASQAKRRKTSALREVNSSSAGSDEDVDVSRGSVSSRKGKRQTGSRSRNGSKLETSTDNDSAGSTRDTTKPTKPKKRVRLASESVCKSKKGKPTLVMTSMHATDQELVLSIAKSLKHFKVIDTVSDSTTHVVCGDHRRTLNVLSGIARGCWLLSMEWVLNSVEAGHWLPEEPYEVHDHFPAGQISRLERLKAGDTYKQDLFAPPGSIYITDNASPPKERLVELVQLCGGQVAGTLGDATLCVGNVKKKMKDTPVVAELWVLDCITQHCQLPLEPYYLDG